MPRKNRESALSKTLTDLEAGVLNSPVAGRGRGTTGGGGQEPSAPKRAQMVKALQAKPVEYWLRRPGCGDKSHDEDCLCDVHIKEPVPIRVSFPHDITFASVIAEHMGYEAPYTTSQVLEIMQMAARAKDLLSNPLAHLVWREDSKVPYEAREYMREAAEAGIRNRDVIKTVQEHWGVTVSQAYISKRRYLYTGQVGSTRN